MVEYKTVLNKETGELQKVAIGSQQTPPASVKAPIDITNINALRTLARNKLVEIIANYPATPSLVPAIKELFDRVDGKAPQSIQLDGQINVVTIEATVEFIRPGQIGGRIVGISNPMVINNNDKPSA